MQTHFFDQNASHRCVVTVGHAIYALYMRYFTIISCLSVLFACSSTSIPPNDSSGLTGVLLSRGVNPDTSSLVILRLSDNHRWSVNSARAEVRYPPASTSKIPHTLIALDTGRYDSDSLFLWDGTERAFDFWNRDHTLASAYKFSAVWVYQDIVSQLGGPLMQSHLSAFDYGNHTIGDASTLTSYWLVGPLETSINEQIVFLRKLVQQDLPVKQQSYAKLRPIMREARGDNWQLFGKTGWRSDGVNQDIGWYVGWVEVTAESSQKPEIFLFAYNMDMQSSKQAPVRREVVKDALQYLGILPERGVQK